MAEPEEFLEADLIRSVEPRDRRKLWRWAKGSESRMRAAMEKRAGGMPVSKIIGARDFWKRSFKVTPDVLDPRPDTETLVEAALELGFSRVLDLGTGSGCILISLLDERPKATGLGVDISEAALAVARENAQETPGATFLQSDWFGAVTGRFDLIVSNPPYIALDEWPGLSREVRDHDPREALTDEGDGLAAYRRITAQAGAFLAPGGHLLVEIGYTQGAAVRALFEGAGLTNVKVLQDITGKDRVVTGCGE